MNINTMLALPSNAGCNQYGASMGRRNQTDGKPETLHLQELRMVELAYDTGGAYWGMGEPIYCAFSPVDTENEYPVQVFVRAATREEAKAKVLGLLPGDGWTFKKA